MNRLIDLLVFTNLPIKKKFLLFFLGTFFWFILVSAIGLVTMFEMNAKSQRIVDVIEPHQRTGHILIRKLRGISISIHKIAIVKETEKVNLNLLKAKARLEDSRSYLNTLLSGGRIKDYSRGTGQFYSEYNVVALTDSQKIKQIEDVKERIDLLDRLIDDLSDMKLNNQKPDLIFDMLSEIDILIRDTIAIINDYIVSLDKEWKIFSDIIKTRLTLSIILTIAVLLISAILSSFFGIIIARSLSQPVKALTEQIRALSDGEVDLTKKLEVTSQDEIGDLTHEFNKLMDTINNVTNFKKVVEEDESLQDIYFRLGKIFMDLLKIEACVIYEVKENSSIMRIVFPPEAEGVELNCKKDIFLDCSLCRAKRTGHIVSSIDFPNVCKYYLDSPEKSHICLPIIVGGVVSGVVQIICSLSETCSIVDMKNKISRAEQYIREVQPVLEAKKLLKALHESSVKDALTGLYNRRFLEESFEKLSAGAIR
ncbi:MAG: HAMP domain-containing protein, partial [Thermodesulfovibrionales bacterium]|nr:HAMP domain-containing protein [Thermodesulfovibrionales bacterium]